MNLVSLVRLVVLAAVVVVLVVVFVGQVLGIVLRVRHPNVVLAAVLTVASLTKSFGLRSVAGFVRNRHASLEDHVILVVHEVPEPVTNGA